MPTATWTASELQAEHWFGSREGELAWCTTATGWSKSARNVFLAPWLTGAAAVIHDGRFDPAERLRPRRGARGQRPLPGADRVPDAGQAHRAAPAPRPAADGLRRRAAGARRRSPPSASAIGLELGRRLRPDRDRPRQRPTSRGEPGPPRLDGQAAAGHRDPDRRRRAAAARRLLPHLLLRYLDGERFEGEWWRDRRPGPRRRGRLPLLRGPRRRHHPLLRLPDRPLRGRVGAASPTPPSPRRRRSPRPTPSAARSCARSSSPATREPSEELARELQEHCKRETAPYKFPRIVEFAERAAEDEQRQDQAGAAAAGILIRVGEALSGTCPSPKRGQEPRLSVLGRGTRRPLSKHHELRKLHESKRRLGCPKLFFKARGPWHRLRNLGLSGRRAGRSLARLPQPRTRNRPSRLGDVDQIDRKRVAALTEAQQERLPQPHRRLGRDLRAGGQGRCRAASPPPSRRTTPGRSTSSAARAAGSGTSTATSTPTSTTASA